MATVAMVLVAGCAWPMYGGNAGRTGLNPGESSIGIGNVATVQLRWSAPSTGSIVVGNGMLYQVGTLTSSPSSPRVLRAYDPLGARGCTGSPASCTPLWSASIPGVGFTGVADVNGVVYTSGGGRVYAYDSAGAMGCAGSPKTCQPLWSADGSSTAPLVDAGKVFVTATDGTGDILAYDAAGSVGCGGVPKVCSPRFRGVIDCAALFPGRTPCTLDNLLTAGNGRVYRSLSILDPVAGSISALVSYDEAGASGCSAGVCHAIAASGPSGNLVAPSNHVISTRKVIGTDPQHPIAHAFVSTMNAAGTVTWGATLATASPSVPDADVGKVAVSSSTVYVPVGNGIQAFALDQPSCPGAGCTPLWRSTTASSLLTVANGVLYDDRGRAFDAAGSTGCSGAPKVCAPVAFIGSSDSGGETEVANGWIYRSLPDGLEAYHLP